MLLYLSSQECLKEAFWSPCYSLCLLMTSLLFVKFSKIFLFANDTKCHRRICNTTNSAKLQDDLNVLYHWSLDNQLYFGVPKCFLLSYHLQYIYFLLTWRHTTCYYLELCYNKFRHILICPFEVISII